MTTASQTDLIARLEQASEPTTKLFRACFNAVFDWPNQSGISEDFRRALFNRFIGAGAWTDAALMLVPEGWAWFCEWIGTPFTEGQARLWIPSQRTQGLKIEQVNCEAAHPALALASAALKARAAKP